MMRGHTLPKRDTGKDEQKHLTGLEGEKLLAAATNTRHAARELVASDAPPRAAPAGPSAED